MNKYLRVIIYCLIIYAFCNSSVFADENRYEIIDYKNDNEILFSSDSYEEVYRFYMYNLNEYTNLCLKENEKIVFMEYGTLFINSSDDKVSYYSINKNEEVEISNYNEYDLLYISEIEDQVKFLIEDDIGVIDKEYVTYYPYGSRSLSYYGVSNGTLYHHISSIIDNYYKYNFALDEAPPFLENGVKYYSYDGHFFYKDFYEMSDDYFLGVNDHAVNNTLPYYNYYAFLPARSYTNYSFDDFNHLFNEILKFDGTFCKYSDFDNDGANDDLTKSYIGDNIKAFVSGEKIYGVNALYSIAWAMLESNNGKSLNAFINNNLYNHEAFDEKEAINNKYRSINSSIYSHIQNYVSKNYCNIFTTYYDGSFMGDFGGGLSSIYSTNPLFGEMYIDKAYYIDKKLGLKDRNEYTLAITDRNISMYYDEETTSIYKTFRDKKHYSFIVLEKGNDYYKVQSEFAMNQTGEYNPEQCTMYVKKMFIDNTLDGNLKINKYNKYVVDYRDILTDAKLINLYSKNDFDINKDFEYIDIDNYDIEGFELVDEKYKPISRKIKDIEVMNLKYPCFQNGYYDLEGGKIKITYEDETSNITDLTSEYVLDMNNIDKETKVEILYKGINKNISVFGNYIVNNSKNTLDDFVTYSKNNFQSFSFDAVKEFDNSFSSNNVINTFIRENDYDFSFEGAYPNFIYYSSDLFPEVINTYYFDIKKINGNQNLYNILSNYNLSYVDSFKVTLSRCFYDIEFVSPILMQVKINDLNTNNVYSVYYVDKNNNYIKLPTEFSDNYVRFLAYQDGCFYIYKYNSASSYSIDDSQLSFTIDNNSKDYYGVSFEGLVFCLISVCGYVIIAIYYLLRRKEDKVWKDFKKSLLQAEYVQEEKQNS